MIIQMWLVDRKYFFFFLWINVRNILKLLQKPEKVPENSYMLRSNSETERHITLP